MNIFTYLKAKSTFIVSCILFINITTQAQNYSIYGTVRDSASGEVLVGATVYCQQTGKGIVTNSYGFYSFSLPNGQNKILCSYIGYKPYTTNIDLDKNIKVDLQLVAVNTKIDEVFVTSHVKINSTLTSKNTLSAANIKSIPSFTGEPDVLKGLQLLPGVQTAGEGSANLSVRGGSFDQNLILLDEAPVYNPSHALGFFSTFNSEAINNVELYKGAFPAQYGGRLSSVVDITMREGNNKKYEVSTTVGLLASRIMCEGPIIKDKASFIISGRYSYAGQMLNFFAGKIGKETLNIYGLRNFNNQNKINFHDLNAKINFQISNKDHLYFSIYNGGDDFYSYALNGNNSLEWGNTTSTLRYNHIFGSNVFSNITAYYSSYRYAYNMGNDIRNYLWRASIGEGGLKTDLSIFGNQYFNVKLGLSLIAHQFNPGSIEPYDDKSIILPTKLDQKQALEPAAYISNNQKITDKLNLDYGVRFSSFTLLGPDTAFTYDESLTNVVSTKSYKKNQPIKTYSSIEPRVSLRYLLNSSSSVKLAYGYVSQYMHLLSNSSLGLPTDIWYPTDNNIKPESSHQYVAGYYKSLFNNEYGLSAELYYKSFSNIIDYKDNANLLMNKHFYTQLLSGNGNSYGLELMLEKKSNDFSGWIGYTLGKTQHTIEGINNGMAFSPRYDIRHNLSVTGSYALNERWELSSTFKFTSGGYITIPEGVFVFSQTAFNYYTQRNKYQLPAYHRLDVNLTYVPERNKTRTWHSEWIFGLNNVYNRKNAYTLFVKPSGYMETASFQKMYLFGIVPTVSYNLKF